MHIYSTDEQLSEMEREFELEMDGDEFEFEADDSDEEWETADGSDSGDFESEDFETAYHEQEHEWLDAAGADYGERFFELAQRSYESEWEVDEAVDSLLSEMENEYFIGGLLKKAKGAAKSIARKAQGLAKKAGINLPSIDALKSMLGPVSGLLKGNLGALIKPALKTALAAHPAGAALLPALQGLGFESSEDWNANREAWNRYATIAREAFESLAETVNDKADDPVEASRLATNAYQKALQNNLKTKQGGRPGRGGRKRVRRVYAAPDEVIVVIQRR